MKKIALIILFISNLSHSQTLVKTYYDPLYKTKLKEVYQVKKNTPTANGYYKSYDKYGYLLVHRNYINNVQNGKSTTYYGAAEASMSYGGEKSLGKVSGVYNYKNDKLDGLQTIYNYSEKGVRYLHKKEIYKSGILINYVEFFPNNQKKKIIKAGTCYEYYENGVKSAEYTANENGQLKGKYTGWYNSGKLEITGDFLNDKKNGEWIEYNEDGSIKNKENYNLGNKLPNEKEKLEEQRKQIKQKQEKEKIRKKIEESKKFEENKRKLIEEKRKLEKKKNDEINYVNRKLKQYETEKENIEKEYRVVDQIKSTISGKTIYKFKKKHLYNSFQTVIYNIESEFNESNLIEKKGKLELGLRLIQKMKILKNLETKGLEKKLKKAKNVNEILSILEIIK